LDWTALGPLLVSQADIEAQLRRRLAELGGAVRSDHEVISITQNSDVVETRVRTGRDEHCIRTPGAGTGSGAIASSMSESSAGGACIGARRPFDGDPIACGNIARSV
jgi:L-2-hydroxyglutarate oxidase LhgO